MYIELYCIYRYLHPSYVHFVDLKSFDDIWSIMEELELGLLGHEDAWDELWRMTKRR